MPPTIVLVHGAFAESASWNGVIDAPAGRRSPGRRRRQPAARPGRRRGRDQRRRRARSTGPVVLVGHSYGGAVITNVARDAGDISALVYVCAFAPDAGESAFELSPRFPGSTLGDARAADPARTTAPTDLAIAGDRFHEQFCADVAGAARRR